MDRAVHAQQGTSARPWLQRVLRAPLALPASQLGRPHCNVAKGFTLVWDKAVVLRAQLERTASAITLSALLVVQVTSAVIRVRAKFCVLVDTFQPTALISSAQCVHEDHTVPRRLQLLSCVPQAHTLVSAVRFVSNVLRDSSA